MVFILSFDIGIKNLAYCYSNNEQIIKWGVLDIQGSNVNETCEKCLSLLNKTFGEDTIDKVLIENQPVQKNPVMKTVQIVVYTYFSYKKVIEEKSIEQISFVSANRKNKFTQQFDITVNCKSKYQQNKKRAIACTDIIVKNSEWYEYFMKHKKKDDLADSYLQTLSYINYTPVLPNPEEPLDVSDNSSTSSISGV